MNVYKLLFTNVVMSYEPWEK